MSDDLPYEPEVNDYVIWERKCWSGTFIDEGWVYFKGDIVEPKKGFPTTPRYITIETGVRDKPAGQLDGSCLHKKVHTLLLCYEQQWKDLRFVKRRESPTIQHYSQYDERAGNWSE
tara:strand:+ start:1131 stop:1478 length:348 start_codon:yes stop_codon:yes gene_type:complete